MTDNTDNTVSSGSEVIGLLMSGGLDSTALLGYILNQGDIPFVINIDYNAANNWAEIKAIDNILRWYEKKAYAIIRYRLTLPNDLMFAEQTSAQIPGETFEEMGEDNKTIFAGRNALLISMAAAACIARNIGALYAGMGQHDEEANFPDCSSEFLYYMKAALDTGYEFYFETPFWCKSRSEVIQRAHHYKVPLHLSYSCYRGGPTHCGRCAACYSRQVSFMKAGFHDPTRYAVPYKIEAPLEEWNVQDW